MSQKYPYYETGIIMEIMDFESFLEDFGRAAKPVMDMSIYRDSFQCACGKSHWFDETIDIVCEGLVNVMIAKVMIVCPENAAVLTSLKIKTFLVVFKFKGFESLAGAHLKTFEDMVAMQAVRSLF